MKGYCKDCAASEFGLCHRHPPFLIRRDKHNEPYGFGYPVVEDDDWCLEHTPKEQSPCTPAR